MSGLGWKRGRRCLPLLCCLLLLAAPRARSRTVESLQRGRGLLSSSLPPMLQVPWPPLLTEAELRRGSYLGSLSGLRRVADKLLVGQPIKIVLLGGSVTNSAVYTRQGTSYASRFFRFVNTSFPHSGHTFVQWGQNSGSTFWFAPCVAKIAGQDPDLVVVEFAVNDRPGAARTSPNRQAYERVLRRALRLPSAPAVVVLNHYSWAASVGDGAPAGLFYAEPEESFLQFARYYDLPAVSLAGAAWRQMQAGIEGFKVDKQVLRNKVPPAIAGQYVFDDPLHPSPTGEQLLAELLCAPLIRAVWEAQLGLAVPERQDARLAGLPPPMLPLKSDANASTCAILEEFPSAVVNSSAGFQFRADRPAALTYRDQGWSFVADQPGEWIVLQASTVSGLPRDTAPAQVLLIQMTGWYGQMGSADVTCISGCVCAPVHFKSGGPARVSKLAALAQVVVTQHPKCQLKVTLAPNQDGSPGTRVQLLGLLVNFFSGMSTNLTLPRKG